MRPELEPPAFRPARPIEWKWVQDPTHGRVVHLWSRRRATWSQQKAWTGTVHERIDAGDDFDGILVALAEDEPETATADMRRRVGTYLFQLRAEGYLEMDFPPPPGSFRKGLRPIAELGRGAIGIAWRCRDEAHGEVVVKHAWDYFVPLEAADARVRAEAVTLGMLDHPGIAALVDTFERDGILHLVRRFVPGEPLDSARFASEADLARLARSVLAAIDHVHGRGLLLLDLAPGNFVRREGGDEAVLIDVGAARPAPDGVATLPHAVGSPAYTAPEIRKEKRATVASDAYGFGRLLFALGAGRPPLAAWDGNELAKHLPPGPFAALVVSLTGNDPAERPKLADARRQLEAIG